MSKSAKFSSVWDKAAKNPGRRKPGTGKKPKPKGAAPVAAANNENKEGHKDV